MSSIEYPPLVFDYFNENKQILAFKPNKPIIGCLCCLMRLSEFKSTLALRNAV